MTTAFFDRIIYIHGFGSSSNGNKVSLLKEIAKELELDLIAVDYDSSASYEDCVAKIKAQIPTDGNSMFIGTSLGAFYAITLANMTENPCIVLNPSLDPYHSLRKYLDKLVNGLFSNISAIESYQGKSFPKPQYGCRAMFETGDDVLDHSAAIEHLKEHAAINIIEGGSHRFESYDLLKKEIIDLNNRGVFDYDED
ncbi:hypothetical protein OURE66S_02696 [Oligella ureolytica]